MANRDQPKPKDESTSDSLDLVREIRSTENVYRKISSISNEELERSRRSKFGQEIISAAWSPDGSLFAWSVGTNCVTLHAATELLPTITSKADANAKPKWAALKEQFSQDAVVRNSQDGLVAVLECSHAVTWLAFGCRTSDKKWHAGEVKYNRFNIQGQVVLAAGLASGDITIWDLATGKLIIILKDHTQAITNVEFAPDGSMVLVSASKDGTVKLWDLMDDGNMFRSLSRDEYASKSIKHVAWSPDATRLAVVGDSKLAWLWELETFTVTNKLAGHQNDVTGCAFSSDGLLLYTCSYDTNVICWDVQTGQRIRSFEHMSPPPSAIFAAGTNDHEITALDLRGDRLATLCNDGNLRVWDVASGSEKPLHCVEIVPDARTLAFASDKLLAVGCQGGIMQFFQLP